MRVVEFGYAGAGGEERLHQLMQGHQTPRINPWGLHLTSLYQGTRGGRIDQQDEPEGR